MLIGPSLLRSATRQSAPSTADKGHGNTESTAFPQDILTGPSANSTRNIMNFSNSPNSDDEGSGGSQHEVPVSAPSLAASTVFGRADENRKKAGPCCDLDRAIHALSATAFLPPFSVEMSRLPKPVITIVEAQKSNDMSGGPYIAYIIRTDIPDQSVHYECKHRYSEFEAFRKLLVKLHPTAVVPPIPEKHSVADYAVKPGKAKEDPHIIEKRKKMLQSFLNRIAAHPVLREEHVFHRFLEGGATWADILSSSGLGYYLKKRDTAVSVSEKDSHFLAAEDYTAKFASQIVQTRKVHKSMLKHSSDMAATYAELGAAYNGWSLSESSLAHAIEQVGQGVDSTVNATSQLVAALETGFAVPLHEYTQFSKAVEKLLKWRHKKHVEYETLSDSLIFKQSSLQKLEASESEAQRLSAVLNAEGVSGHTRQLSTGGGIMATLNSLIDNDPAMTRRNNISRTKDRISTIEEQREVCRAELQVANEEIQKDLDRFQMDKVKDLRNMLLSYALAQRDFHRKATKAWEEAKAEVEKIKP
ncbi:hypothetical protein SpCBS45565_g07257 [Spizellomyces sp. 'palustris']|nr:hypothetical protein SpCBS45565_g07257 [Spizellomyces sp. 'palustris']